MLVYFNNETLWIKQEVAHILMPQTVFIVILSQRPRQHCINTHLDIYTLHFSVTINILFFIIIHWRREAVMLQLRKINYIHYMLVVMNGNVFKPAQCYHTSILMHLYLQYIKPFEQKKKSSHIVAGKWDHLKPDLGKIGTALCCACIDLTTIEEGKTAGLDTWPSSTIVFYIYIYYSSSELIT